MLGWFIYLLLYIWLHTMRWLGWLRWRVEGSEHLPPREAGGLVVVMNHVHWVDIPVVATLLPFRYRLSWLAKAEIFRNPFARWFFQTMHVIPIKRGRRDANALGAAVQALRDGAVLLVFPEGTRSRSGVLTEGRGGAIRLAIQAGVPIVPVAIVGTEHGARGSLLRRPVHLRIGEPLLLQPNAKGSLPATSMDQLTDAMMGRIAALLPAERRGYYKGRIAQSEGGGESFARPDSSSWSK
ncbi:lysophospholipid acyltransferase family protein [Candidatus Viridilinea mediisalina]|uniref:1-acyl-sn-glycerol-3-phosphate acyltransferase n=1 Tax=Candidatus Viridilinea mediisalina TaxID=2024553 RepID=A0A2A6RF13_9CHLR|nr:lysophospholipid acyltransferase family protein [Candidatus Viridilinea mediisalina]PDW01446.1 1-acyl-sn-glycerol-3-phosphate acyltransferase [Candidatus Viridilinea mediisalina]